jgi:voltage-gated potassium channel
MRSIAYRPHALGSESVLSGPVAGAMMMVFWIVLGTLVYASLDEWSLLDGFYMTVITISTVGFHEIHPLSPPVRLFTIFLVMAGLTTAFYTLTRIGQTVFEGELLDVLGRRGMERDIGALKNHFIVCGFGKVGRPVAEGLAREGVPFCVIENQADVEPALQNEGFLYVLGDATDEHVLEQAGLERAATLLALLSSDADNLYLTMAARDANPGLKIIARAYDQAGEMRIKRGGADQVISPTRIAGLRVLQAAVNPTALEFMEIVTQHEALQLSMADITVSEGSALNGISIAEAGIRSRFGVIVVAIKDPEGDTVFNPNPVKEITTGDTLVVLGEDLDIAELQTACA